MGASFVWSAIIFSACVALVWREAKFLTAVNTLRRKGCSAPGQVLASDRVIRPWHADRPLKTPRYVAAVRFRDAEGREYLTSSLAPKGINCAAGRRWVLAHKPGDRVKVFFPPGEPESATVLPLEDLSMLVFFKAGFLALVTFAGAWASLQVIT